MNDNVIKASGDRETFDEGKIITSLRKAGASDKIISIVLKKVKKKIKHGMIGTDQIYSEAIKYLKELHPAVANKYTLKRAIMEMGPAGFIFEKYISKILGAYNFETNVGVIVKGHCVDQEIDIIANKNEESFMIECKYHNHPGIYSDLKTVLYTYSRYLDVKNSNPFTERGSEMFSYGWLITNTKCTTEAIKYANCMNLKISAWHYPEHENLENLIEKQKLYPITILSTISRNQVNKLFDKNIFMVKELSSFKPSELQELLSIDSAEVEIIFNEVDILLG